MNIAAVFIAYFGIKETQFHLDTGAAASSLGSAESCRVEGRAIDTALGQCFTPNSSHWPRLSLAQFSLDSA